MLAFFGDMTVLMLWIAVERYSVSVNTYIGKIRIISESMKKDKIKNYYYFFEKTIDKSK